MAGLLKLCEARLKEYSYKQTNLSIHQICIHLLIYTVNMHVETDRFAFISVYLRPHNECSLGRASRIANNPAVSAILRPKDTSLAFIFLSVR